MYRKFKGGVYMAQSTAYYQYLPTNIGNISLNPEVFYTIAKNALKDVKSVKIEDSQNFFSGKSPISCKVIDDKLEISIDISVAYGHHVSKICEEIQTKVTQAIFNMCMVEVAFVNVKVIGIDFD